MLKLNKKQEENGVNNTPNVEEIAAAAAAPSAEIQKATYTNDEEGDYLLFSRKYMFNDLDVKLNEFTPNEKMREPRVKMPENLLEIARELKSLYDDYKIEDFEIKYCYDKLEVNISWTDDTFVYFEIDEDERYGFDTYAPGGLYYEYSPIGNTVASIVNEIQKSREDCRHANEYYKNEEKNEENEPDFSFQVSQEFLKLLKTDQKERQIHVDYYNDYDIELEIEDNIHTWAKTYVRIFDDYFIIDILHDDYDEDDVLFFEKNITPAEAAKEIWWAYVKEANVNNRRKYIMSLLGRKLSDFTEKYIKEDYQEGDYNYHIETLAGEKIELLFYKESFEIVRNDVCGGAILEKIDIPYDYDYEYTEEDYKQISEKCIAVFDKFIENHQTNLDKLEEKKNRLFTS